MQLRTGRLSLVISLAIAACTPAALTSGSPLTPTPLPGSSAPPLVAPSAPPTADPQSEWLPVEAVFPGWSVALLRQGLRTQAAVSPEDLSLADVRRLVVMVNGKGVPPSELRFDELTLDRTQQIVVSLTILRKLSGDARVDVLLPGTHFSLAGRTQLGKAHLNLRSTAGMWLSEALAKLGKPNEVVPERAIDRVVPFLESLLLTGGNSSNAIGSLNHAVETLGDALAVGIVDVNKLDLVPRTRGGGGGRAPAPDSCRGQSSGTVSGPYNVGASPQGVAVDGEGNVWAANADDNTVTKLDPFGNPIGTYNVGAAPYAIAFDGDGNAWVVNNTGNTVTKLEPDGDLLGTFNVGLNPFGIVVDGDDNVWVTNMSGDNVTKLDPDGNLIGTYNVGDAPQGIAVDGDGNVWIANSGDDNVSKLDPDGNSLGVFATGLGPRAVAIDSANNAWVVDHDGGSVRQLDPAGNHIGGAILGDHPIGIAIDADDHVWISHLIDGQVIRLDSLGDVVGWYVVGSGLNGIALDACGNAWVNRMTAHTLYKIWN